MPGQVSYFFFGLFHCISGFTMDIVAVAAVLYWRMRQVADCMREFCCVIVVDTSVLIPFFP